LAHKRIKEAVNAKTKADKTHASSFVQLDVLVQAAEAAKSLVAEAEISTIPGTALEDLKMKAAVAASDQ
jgi:hypothetical protein